MSLINCPECSKEISDLAESCPHCGCPIEGNLEIELKKEFGDELQFPEMPKNPSIGKQIVNWGGDAYFKGEFRQAENVVKGIKDGKVNIVMHQEGVAIISPMFETLIELHFKQIINFKQTTAEELTTTNKSVVGRAIVGGLLLGPLGAVVGGMSGMNKNKLANTHFLVVNYWDLETKKPQSLLIRGKKLGISLFIDKMGKLQEKTKDKPVASKVKNEKQGGCAGVIVLLIIATGIVSSFLGAF